LESKIVEAVGLATSRSKQALIKAEQEKAELLAWQERIVRVVAGEQPSAPPGPKPGQVTNKERFWKIAEGILSGADAPVRGRGFRTELYRRVHMQAKASGLPYDESTVRKNLKPGVDGWEEKNPT